jgi:hypothetical protein
MDEDEYSCERSGGRRITFGSDKELDHSDRTLSHAGVFDAEGDAGRGEFSSGV